LKHLLVSNPIGKNVQITYVFFGFRVRGSVSNPIGKNVQIK